MINTIEEGIKWYQRESINFIPLQLKSKKPIASWKEYQKRKITDEEIDLFFKSGDHNIGAVCGGISDNMFCLDFDTKEVFEKYFSSTKNLVCVKTGRGYHVFFKADEPVKPLKCFDDEGREILTLKSEGGYVVGIGSVHPNNSIYILLNDISIPRLHGNVREDVKKRALEIGLNFGNSENNEEIDIAFILKGTPRGGQDTAIMHLSRYLRRQGASFDEALVILQKWSKLSNPVISLCKQKSLLIQC